MGNASTKISGDHIHQTLSNLKAPQQLEEEISTTNIPSKASLQLREINFKIHIAIDFGTDGCALAFAYNNKVTVYNKWNTKKRQRAVKAKAQILLNEKNEVVAFGDNAKIIYSGLSGNEKIKWKFFDKFKMSLYGADINENDEKNENNCDSIYLKTLNNRKCAANIVFIRAFQYLQKIAIEYMDKITNNNENITKDEIQWIITVPAIWSEKAKSKMKQWIYDAKLINNNIKDQCLIVYEPDCGALSIFEEYKKSIHTEKKCSDEEDCNDIKDNSKNDKQAEHIEYKLKVIQNVEEKNVEEQNVEAEHTENKTQVVEENNNITDTVQHKADEVGNHDDKSDDNVNSQTNKTVQNVAETTMNNTKTDKLEGKKNVTENVEDHTEHKTQEIEENNTTHTVKHKADAIVNHGDKSQDNVNSESNKAVTQDVAETLMINLKTDEVKQSKNKYSFNIGDKYILIDAGGGTVDMICHKIIDENSAEEIHFPTGSRCGGCNVDDSYITLLESMCGAEWIHKFQQESPNIYLEILDNFQIAKLKFYKKKNAKTHKVDLPYQFVQYLHKKCSDNDMNLQETLKQYVTKISNDEKNENEDKVIKLEEESLILGVEIWKSMFDKCIDQIIQDIEKLMCEAVLKENLKYLCLVGGFSSSKYFQFRVKQQFGVDSKHKLQVIIPKKPTLSVVIGAAYFGIRKQFIKARILKYTYGLNVAFKLNTAKAAGISSDYMKRNKVEFNGKFYIKDCFRIIASKGQRVTLNEKILDEAISGGGTSHVEILCSHKRKPAVVTDGVKLATIVGSNSVSIGAELITEFHFSGTMFKVYSYEKDKMDLKQEITINYGK